MEKTGSRVRVARCVVLHPTEGRKESLWFCFAYKQKNGSEFELHICGVFVGILQNYISVHRWMVCVPNRLLLLSGDTIRKWFLHGMPDTSILIICHKLIYLSIFTGKLLSILWKMPLAALQSSISMIQTGSLVLFIQYPADKQIPGLSYWSSWAHKQYVLILLVQ